jgi:pimeloyl-ACP methyl ester carboxylesterase
MTTKRVNAGVLDVAYMESGPADGPPVLLLHGFPYDVHAFDKVSEILAHAGCRVLVPYLRGFGPTRFLDPHTPRSGQQAALAHDLVDFMDALAIPQAILAGFDWGGRAACITAALWPDRARGLVTFGGYNIQDISSANRPATPENEHRLWYQYYFHGERGRAGLQQNRHALCRLLWQLWSPDWRFSDAEYDRSATSFDNPDFVDVVIHSYRHRYGLAPDDDRYTDTERRLAAQPAIQVPTVNLDGATDGVLPPGGTAGHRSHFSGGYDYQLLPGVGHNGPQESPHAFAEAVLSLLLKSETQ